jgi:dihydroorotate dehydrogenase
MTRMPLFAADAAARFVRFADPERAHRLTVKALATGFGPRARLKLDPRLATRIAGLDFPNPLGLAAGFDKNAQVPDAMLALGFGFVEVGAVTPRPQPGNDRPRVFRLEEDLAVINRYGFNNDGLERIAARLRARRRRGGIVGVNLGANKDGADRVEDFAEGVVALDGLVDFYTVNISSPNTPGLRALQGKDALDVLLSRVLAARAQCASRAPIFLKVAPDLTDEDKADIAASVRAAGIDALIVSNTTIARPPGLRSRHAAEKGGLSGAPLFSASTQILAEFYAELKGAMPLIGVGGVLSAREAYRKILAGAALVQLYTALVYEGPSLPSRIVRALPEFLSADGFNNVAEAVGKG